MTIVLLATLGPVPLPITRSAMDKLGKRLCADQVEDEDWECLASVLTSYQTMLDQAQAVLEAAGFAPTTRVKSTPTLIDKLRRGTSFKSVHDVAGARVVTGGGRIEQDRVVSAISAAFETEGHRVQILDRRANPSFGYRAVHLIIQMDGLPLEVQVRTQLQDLWAQIVERLGDLWGRELRYGEPLEPPNQPLIQGRSRPTREDLVTRLQELADMIDSHEQLQRQALQIDKSVRESSVIEQHLWETIVDQVAQVESGIIDRLDNVRKIVATVEGGHP